MHEYVTIARRKGQDWFVGIINNSTARSILLSLKFLPPGNFNAEIYSDAPDFEKDPNHLITLIKTFCSSDVIAVNLAAGGRQAIRLVRN